MTQQEKTEEEKRTAYDAFLDKQKQHVEEFVRFGGFTEQQAQFLINWMTLNFYTRI